MSAQGKESGSRLVLCLLFLGLWNKNQKRALMRPFRNNWLRLVWPGSLSPCQGRCLHFGQEIHLCQIILHHHQETQMK